MEWKEISDILQRCGIKRNIDVSQLYLAKKGIVSIPDLSRFPMLRRLWVNNNKIKHISCLAVSCCLTELYLQNNALTSISGALGHLTCLKILSLHNNELRRLEESVRELKRMQCLHTVKPQYHHYVVHHLPSVKMLDRKEVKQEERTAAFQQYCPERHRVRQSLAFGRRAEAAPLTGTSFQMERAGASGGDTVIHG
ncbi:leucine-rich repeat-containing protein 72 [Conger conger]|uniref:leucine-rich repeat-containing protein 72 n=1 Tax=Conger conger TaxID=82655 RepID=UPI002A5ADEBB|nr:leucine-rich repeat-containing protein 72 [Conger conger]